MREISLSFAGPDNAKELNLLDRAAHTQNKWWGIRSRSDWARLLKASNRHSVIIAKYRKNIIGYLYARLKRRGTLWIEDVFILPEYRRRHLTTKMIARARRIWKRIEVVSLLTPDRNVKIFEKMGFSRTMNYMSLTLKKTRINPSED